ncbi:recombination mediator RecR [Desulfopila inferna]|uniref:recombination mediator RecR n=1 Tax=Desulfopila inferna TaxID=468528 RepID=UPI001966A175|nr:recombination mediator RecR [Desulfopila inferna]MBM9605991.1 recombination protein RecR [Desulfopila inferna]
MQIVPPALDRLIQGFSTLPGIGKKTATRLAMHVLRRSPAEAGELSSALAALHGSIQLCSSCFAFSENDPCVICGDARRTAELVCVVEQAGDLMAIEKTGIFRGHYHILHGVLSPIDGIGPDEIKTRELIARSRNGVVKEVLIATSSTVPGEATASYLIDKLHDLDVKVTRLAYGIPMGMDIKYADSHTLSRAIEGRLAAF